MNNPKSVFDKRTNPRTQNFIFISYSHKDSEMVYDDLDKLYDRQLNYWYDKELSGGDKWDEKVKDIILSDACKGAILYISKPYLMSEAVECEIETLYKKHIDNPNFKITLVSLYKKSVLELIRDIFVDMKTYDSKELFNAFPYKRLKNIVDNIDDKIIYYQPTFQNDATYIDKICDDYKKDKIDVFSDDETLLSRIKEKMKIVNIDNQMALNLGYYPQFSTDNNYFFNNGIHIVKDKKYYTKNNNTFIFENLTWYILQIDGTSLRLCCKYAIDNLIVNEVEDYLWKIFVETAFDNVKVTTISVPNEDDLKQIKSIFSTGLSKTSFASQNKNNFELYLIKEKEKHKLINKDFMEISIPVEKNMKVYILPVITVDVKNIL